MTRIPALTISKPRIRFSAEPQPKSCSSSGGSGKRTAVAEDWPPPPRPPYYESPEKRARPWFRLLALLGVIYAGASVDKTAPIEQAVVHYPLLDPKVVDPGQYFLNPPWIAESQKYELRDQSSHLDISGFSRDKKPVDMRLEVGWAFRYGDDAYLRAVDANLRQMSQEKKDELYLYNWGQNGPDKNGVVYFAENLKAKFKLQVQDYIAQHDAKDLTPDNVDKIAQEILRDGFGQVPGIADPLRRLHPEIRIQQIIVSIGNGVGVHKDTY